MQVQTFSNRHFEVSPDGTIELSAEDAAPLIRVGWTKLAELPEDQLPGYGDGYPVSWSIHHARNSATQLSASGLQVARI